MASVATFPLSAAMALCADPDDLDVDVGPGAALPTLLLGRAMFGAEQDLSAKGPSHRPRRPAPAALVLDEVPEEPASPGLRVKNTFLESGAAMSPSLGAFYRERVVHTCPSRHAGRLAAFLAAAPEAFAETPIMTPVRPPPGLPPSPGPLRSPYAIQTPMGEQVFEYRMPMMPDIVHALATEPAPCAFRSSRFLDLATTPPEVASLWSPPPLPPPAHFAAARAPPAAPPSEEKPRTVLSLASALVRDGAGAGAPPPAYPADRVVPSYPAPCAAQLAPIAPPPPPPPPTAPAPGSQELPSVGSAEHASGGCKPCAFVHTKGCQNAFTCAFCHLCDPEEKRRRRKEKTDQRRARRGRPGASSP